jgi:hypothetical protein
LSTDDAIEGVPFLVWPIQGDEADGRSYTAATARQAAECRGRDDYDGYPTWQESYRVRDGVTGQIWDVIVGVVQEPSFVAIAALKVPMLAAMHVLWGARVLCEDLRLRGVPRDWPEGQRWTSLRDVADGAAAPLDRCEACWAKAPGLVEGLLQIGKKR